MRGDWRVLPPTPSHRPFIIIKYSWSVFGTHRRHLNFDVEMFRSDSTGLFFIINSPISVGTRENREECVSQSFLKDERIKIHFPGGWLHGFGWHKKLSSSILGRKKVKICFFDPRIISLNFAGAFSSCRGRKAKKTQLLHVFHLDISHFRLFHPRHGEGRLLTHKHTRTGGKKQEKRKNDIPRSGWARGWMNSGWNCSASARGW